MTDLKIVLLCIVFFLSIRLSAQDQKKNQSDSITILDAIEKLKISEKDTLLYDSTFIEKEEDKFSDTFYDWAFYGGYQVFQVPHPEMDQPASSFLLGFQYKKVFFEASLVENQGEYSFPIIFPNDFRLDYMYLESSLGLQLHNQRFLESSAMISFGHGDMLWESVENGRDLFRDKFGIIKAGLRTEFTPKKFVSLFSTLGYQSMLGLELERVTQQDMSGFYISLGLKFGYYKMTEL